MVHPNLHTEQAIVHTEHVLIDASPDAVFEFLTIYENVTEWATNFVFDLRTDGEEWIARTPFGESTFEIDADRERGVVDQILDGDRTPIRVVPVEAGTVVSFTLTLPPDLPESDVEDGIEGLEAELETLKSLVEGDS